VLLGHAEVDPGIIEQGSPQRRSTNCEDEEFVKDNDAEKNFKEIRHQWTGLGV
jgi:hypothetical protein